MVEFDRRAGRTRSPWRNRKAAALRNICGKRRFITGSWLTNYWEHIRPRCRRNPRFQQSRNRLGALNRIDVATALTVATRIGATRIGAYAPSTLDKLSITFYDTT
jgi:hypothetical protein